MVKIRWRSIFSHALQLDVSVELLLYGDQVLVVCRSSQLAGFLAIDALDVKFSVLPMGYVSSQEFVL